MTPYPSTRVLPPEMEAGLSAEVSAPTPNRTNRMRLGAAAALGVLAVVVAVAVGAGGGRGVVEVVDIGTTDTIGVPRSANVDVPGGPGVSSLSIPAVSVPVVSIPSVSIPAVPPSVPSSGAASAVGDGSTTVVTTAGGGVVVTSSGSAVASTGGNVVGPNADGSTPPVVTGEATAIGNRSTVEVRGKP